jgi:hypothetical protein
VGPGTAPNLTILVQSLLDAALITLADALAARAALAGVGELSSAEARTRAHRRRRALLWSDQFARTMRLQHPFYTHPGSCQHPTAPGSRQRIFSPVILPCCIVRSARSAAARKFSRKFHAGSRHWAPGRDLDRRFKESHLSTQTSTDHIYLGLGFVPAFQPHPLSYRHTCTTHSNKLLLSATQQHWATAGCRLHRVTEHQGTHKPSFDRRHPFVNKKTANAQMWSLMNETNGANSSQGIDGTSEPKCCLQMDETYETNETNETK